MPCIKGIKPELLERSITSWDDLVALDNEIGFEVDPQPPILCDNLQTVRLVNKDTERL
jgi:hypothetical protein